MEEKTVNVKEDPFVERLCSEVSKLKNESERLSNVCDTFQNETLSLKKISEELIFEKKDILSKLIDLKRSNKLLTFALEDEKKIKSDEKNSKNEEIINIKNQINNERGIYKEMIDISKINFKKYFIDSIESVCKEIGAESKNEFNETDRKRVIHSFLMNEEILVFLISKTKKI
eukprot:GHVL01037407.1.p1 GENE.GHVL01037407.1~~GHVL01037407.1.p1  ORF type:complete len:180 (-),score=62.78 GHVL01037407.1:1342-1860(-)